MIDEWFDATKTVMNFAIIFNQLASFWLFEFPSIFFFYFFYKMKLNGKSWLSGRERKQKKNENFICTVLKWCLLISSMYLSVLHVFTMQCTALMGFSWIFISFFSFSFFLWLFSHYSNSYSTIFYMPQQFRRIVCLDTRFFNDMEKELTI